MSDTSVIDYGKSKIKAAKFIGEMDGSVAAKTEIAALTAIDSGAQLTEAVAAINSIIAALKA